MTLPHPSAAAPTSLAHVVDAFEDALLRGEEPDPGKFLPGPGSPLFLPALAELIRVDLDHAWSRGRPKRLADYRRRFPVAFYHPQTLRAIAFQEFRLRRPAGQP